MASRISFLSCPTSAVALTVFRVSKSYSPASPLGVVGLDDLPLAEEDDDENRTRRPSSPLPPLGDIGESSDGTELEDDEVELEESVAE